jgi:hypothetical protein
MDRKNIVLFQIVILSLFIGGIVGDYETIPKLSQSVYNEITSSLSFETPNRADAPAISARGNLIRNSSFEETNVEDLDELYNSIYSSNYEYTNYSYGDNVYAGNYAALEQAQGSSLNAANTNMIRYFGTNQVKLSEILTLEVRLFIPTNVTILQGATINTLFILTNGMNWNYIYLYYATSNSYSNDSNNIYYIFNCTYAEWNAISFDLTTQFTDVWGDPSGYYIYYVNFQLYSPPQAEMRTECIWDNLYLKNTTNANYFDNSDFESPNNFWNTDSNSQSTAEIQFDSETNNQYLNIGVTSQIDFPNNAEIYLGRISGYPGSYFITQPRDLIFNFDWNYHQNAFIGLGYRYAALNLAIYNATIGHRYISYILGSHTNNVEFTNSSSNYYFYSRNWNSIGAWYNEVIDIYELVNQTPWKNMTLINFNIQITQQSSKIGNWGELSVDNFCAYTQFIPDEGFELSFPSTGQLTGWVETADENYIKKTTQSHSGSYAANLSDSGSGDTRLIYQSWNYFEVKPGLYTDFWWNLQSGAGSMWAAYAYFHINSSVNLYYIFGSSPSFPFSNDSNNLYYFVELHNQTNSWYNLQRNLWQDLVNWFGENPKFYVEQVLFAVYAIAGSSVSLLLDDLNFQDRSAPEISAVNLISSPEYYQPTTIMVKTYDYYSRIVNYSIYYRIPAISTSWNKSAGIQILGGFQATIPMYPYASNVEFYVEVYDESGNQAIANNFGAFYNFQVGDDRLPTINFLFPFNNTIITANQLIRIQAEDVGSGIAYIEFYGNNILLGNQSGPNFEQEWNSRVLPNGVYSLTARAVDNAGNSKNSSEQIIVRLSNDFNGPRFMGVGRNVTAPEHLKDISIYAAIQSESAISAVLLFYQIGDGGWVNISMSSEGPFYSGVIPGQPWNETVKYYITASDIYSQTTSNGTVAFPYSYIVQDFIKPVGKLNGPPTNQKIKGDLVCFEVSGTDLESGICNLTLKINDQVLFSSNDSFVYYFNSTDFPDGTYNFTVIIEDNNGNIAVILQAYQIDNPPLPGFLLKIWDKIDKVLQSYYGILVGAGAMLVFYITVKVTRFRKQRKIQRGTHKTGKDTKNKDTDAPKASIPLEVKKEPVPSTKPVNTGSTPPKPAVKTTSSSSSNSLKPPVKATASPSTMSKKTASPSVQPKNTSVPKKTTDSSGKK